MDYYNQPKRRTAARLRWQPPRSSLFLAFIAVGATAGLIRPATSQHSYPALNTPPILYVPDRNWRISESEQVGQIIARIRAEDAENDGLVFGLEPHFHANYAHPSENGGGGAGEGGGGKLPFRIDPVGGVVYLNESLVGRAGENFFLYITVSDGQLTAKNEVFVNILGRSNSKNPGARTPPPVTRVAHNISHFFPAFDQLPGVQSIRNQQPNNRPANNLPPGFVLNPSFFAPHRPGAGPVAGSIDPSVLSDPNRQSPSWPVKAADSSDESGIETHDLAGLYPSVAPTQATSTIRTKLAPIGSGIVHDLPSGEYQNSTAKSGHGLHTRPTAIDPQDFPSTLSPTAFSITTIPAVVAVCGLFAALVAFCGYLCRKRLCAISKTLKKKSKEEMVKKSNQSNLSSNLTDDSRNSMVMQHWNGPTAYGNRYVPWERDQQMVQQPVAASQLSTSVANGVTVASPAVALSDNVAGAGLGFGGGVGMTPDGGRREQDKYDRWEFPRHRLKFFNILGEGAFGQVWRCEATDIDGIEGVTTVAVKTLKENASEVEKNDLVSELQVMKSLEPHVNVVRLLGCCTDKDPLFVIIEYVNRGKLQTYLRNSRAERHYGNTHGKSNILTSGDLTSFMYQVAKGMDYLTSRGIIHRDLAARNVLISDDHTCKVADFGFARDVVTSKIYERKSEGKLPIRWMAIESLYDNIFSVKSDIWSFGILMWEIVTLGSTPYPGISAADVMRKVRDGHRLEKPEHCRRELYNIMYYCWTEDANERPTFAELVQMLDKLLHTEMDYIELERFPDHNYYNILNLSGEKL